ncbi:MAG TPA: pseudouridine synthase, partial [Nevskiaceae bacterium]|nr:pseudouridine synthase [Nevskiaceae bacterium]
LGQKVGMHERIAVDGRLVKLLRSEAPTRVLLYKKRVGELVTRSDPEGRRTVFRKLPKLEAGRWIAVGRLDINTSGLLLMTNDGELARRLTHPSFEIDRTYAARVLGTVDDTLLERLRAGIELDDGPAHVVAIERGEPADGTAANAANHWLYITVREGRNRLVRRLFESQGLQVSRLIRVAYGPVRLHGGIRSGTAAELDSKEVDAVCAAVGLTATAASQGRRKGGADGARAVAPRTALRSSRPVAHGTRRDARAPGERGAIEPGRARRPSSHATRNTQASARTGRPPMDRASQGVPTRATDGAQPRPRSPQRPHGARPGTTQPPRRPGRPRGSGRR